jgi:acetyl esterase/lipase
MGFSAGGHLASTACTKFHINYIENTKRISLRPDFQILLYPVISMENSLTHSGSRSSLLGGNPSKELVDLFSNEKQVTSAVPPTFLVHGTSDKVVSVKNSLRFYEALIDKGVKAEMHILQEAGHGFGYN